MMKIFVQIEPLSAEMAANVFSILMLDHQAKAATGASEGEIQR